MDARKTATYIQLRVLGLHRLWRCRFRDGKAFEIAL
jgi:hypothetical protein